MTICYVNQWRWLIKLRIHILTGIFKPNVNKNYNKTTIYFPSDRQYNWEAKLAKNNKDQLIISTLENGQMFYKAVNNDPINKYNIQIYLSILKRGKAWEI